jgi:hypothetical protein
MRKLLILLFIITISSNCFAAKALAPWVGMTLKGTPCPTGQSSSQYGHDTGLHFYDYNDPKDRQSTLGVVEAFHFTSDVELHIKGHSDTIPGDLNYTITTFPNHHKALLSAIRYQLKLNLKLLNQNIPLKKPVECYLQRAMHFTPNDAGVVSLYAYFLKEINQLEKAASYYEKALSISPSNSKIEYSYSLLLIELKQYQKANQFAQKAYAHDNPPETLKNKLIQLNAWEVTDDK